MSDGNTATTLSPAAQENDMGQIKALFDKAANAIVDASRLAIEVSDLRQDVATLRSEVEKVRKDNQWLDEQLGRVRGERDTANNRAREAEAGLSQAKRDLDSANEYIKLADDETTKLKAELATVKAERDAALESKVKACDEVYDLYTKLDKIRGLVDQLKVEATPADEPKPAPEPVPEPYKAEPTAIAALAKPELPTSYPGGQTTTPATADNAKPAHSDITSWPPRTASGQGGNW